MQNFIFGLTENQLPIPAYRFGTKGPQVLILGGVHGDEYEGVVAAFGLYKEFLRFFPYQLQVTLVPTLNLDGVIAKTRTNANGVDLNRNMSTKDWSSEVKGPRYHPGPSADSESETKALRDFILNEKPKFVLSLHSWHPVLNVNGDCLAEAEVLHKMTGYKIDADIGYPTPGCLGTFAGLERTSPTLTYEIQRGQSPKEILRIHIPAILEALKVTEKRSQ
jgi:protein MpaA